MGRRTQQRRRRRVEELAALRHDEREFRRRWLARVDAWCEGLRRGGPNPSPDASPDASPDVSRSHAGRSRGVVESVLRELVELGEAADGALARETRARLEAACRGAVGTRVRDA